MSKRRAAAPAAEVINLLDSEDSDEILNSDEDEPSSSAKAAPPKKHARTTATHQAQALSRACKPGRQEGAKAKPAAKKASQPPQVRDLLQHGGGRHAGLDPPTRSAFPQKSLRQQLSFTVSQSSGPSQPGGSSSQQQQQASASCAPRAQAEEETTATCSQPGPQQPQLPPAATQRARSQLPAIHEHGGSGRGPGPGPGPASRATAAAAAALRRPASLPESPPGPPPALWIDKHAPRTCEDLHLAVQKKKVQQVRDWLEHQAPDKFRREYCRLMIVTGPSGCCKSTVVRVVAEDLGFEVVEWTPPTPTMFHEFQYQASFGSDVKYTSKLDEFDSFVSRAKYPPLALAKADTPGHGPTATQQQQQRQQAPAAAAGSQSGPVGAGRGLHAKLTLIDDLPHAADAAGRKRLTESLKDLVTTSRSPVVLVTTESSSSSNPFNDSGANAASGSAKSLHKDILAGLQAVGALVVSFNPVTDANLVKVLMNVAQKEQVALSTAAASSIASVANGDVRNAVQTLQMLYDRHARGGDATTADAGQQGGAASNKRRKGAGGTTVKQRAAAAKAASARPLQADELVSIAQARRDTGLQLFHVLGKILYNKRGVEGEEDEEGEEEGEGEAGPSGTQQRWGGSKRGRSAAAQARAEAAAKVREQAQRVDIAEGVGAAATTAAQGSPLPPHLLRPPMRYDPEALLRQSALDALGAATFLHENYTSFVAHDAVEDAAAAAGYLSDAAALALAAQPRAGGDYLGFSGLADMPDVSVLQAAAGSVATRGLLFANTHPAPRRFLAMRGPASAQVARAADANDAALQAFGRRLALQLGAAPAGGSSHMLASHALPYMRLLLKAPEYAWLVRVMPSEWSHVWEGKVTVVAQHQGQQGLGGPGVRQTASASEMSALVEGMSLAGTGEGSGEEGDMQEDEAIEES